MVLGTSGMDYWVSFHLLVYADIDLPSCLSKAALAHVQVSTIATA